MPQRPQVSEEEFLAWSSHPVTRRLMDFLRANIEDYKTAFVEGALTMTDQWASGMKQAEVIGRCEMARTILAIDHLILEKFDEE